MVFGRIWSVLRGIICLVGLTILACANSTDISITGSSTVAPLTLEIAKAFESHNKNVRMSVQTGGSARGIHDVRKALANIGMVSRELGPAEQDLTAHTIALDGICLILHRDNPVAQLTSAQIVGIYTGEIQNWQDVGGQDQRITVVHKAEGRSTLELFLTFFSLNNRQIKADVIIGDNQQGMKTVLGNTNAIAYTSIGAAEFEQSLGAPLKRLPLNGVVASTDNVQNGNYALSRPLNLVVQKGPASQTAFGAEQQVVQSFLRFAQSEAVRELIQQQYLVIPDEQRQ